MAQRGPGGEKGNTVVVFIEILLIAPFTLSVTLVETLIVTPPPNKLPYKLMVPQKNPLAPPPPPPHPPPYISYGLGCLEIHIIFLKLHFDVSILTLNLTVNKMQCAYSYQLSKRLKKLNDLLLFAIS